MALNLVCAVLDRGPRQQSDALVLLALADSADKDSGECWPSHKTIAHRARLSDRQVRTVLARLRADGWVTWEARKRGNGSAASNLYCLNLEKLGEAPRKSVPPGDGPPRKSVPASPEVTSDHAPEVTSPLEPSQNKNLGAKASKPRSAPRSASSRSETARGARPSGKGASGFRPVSSVASGSMATGSPGAEKGRVGSSVSPGADEPSHGDWIAEQRDRHANGLPLYSRAGSPMTEEAARMLGVL